MWAGARQAVADGDYEKAILLLQQVIAKNPDNVDAQNYLGYANSRIGKIEEAKRYYARALALNPDHRGANEYLGELHLKLGELAQAEERLKVLDRACFFGCDEYYALRDAIAEYKRTGKFESRKRL
jgi:tetratricopeptide (TPR) repeat protein